MPDDKRTQHDLEVAGQATLNEIDKQLAYLNARRKRVVDHMARLKLKMGQGALPVEMPEMAYSADFEEIWATYPARQGQKREKKAAFTRWRGMKAQDKELLKKAVSNYARSNEAKRGYARDMVRFLKVDMWPSWITPSQAMMQGNDPKNPQPRQSGAAAAVEEVLNAKR